LYKLEEGSSDKSYGEEIARELGLYSENITETLEANAGMNGYSELLR